MSAPELRRLERLAEHAHTLGPRFMLDALLTVAAGEAVAEVLADAARSTPAYMKETGGDRFHRPPPRPVPPELMQRGA